MLTKKKRRVTTFFWQGASFYKNEKAGKPQDLPALKRTLTLYGTV
jgi:hypothetical protein